MLPRAVTARVAFVPGTAFFADGFGAQSMRLSYCYPTPERIREGVRRLVGVIEEELELRRTFGTGARRRAGARAADRGYDGPGTDLTMSDTGGGVTPATSPGRHPRPSGTERCESWSWPAGCPTSGTCRCAPGAGSPRRCARPGVEVDVRDVDADLLPAAARGPPRLRGAAAARRDRRGRRRARGARAGRAALRRRPAVGLPRRPSTSRSPRRWSPGPGCTRPAGVTLPHETFRELGAAAVMEAIVASVGLPLIVKPARGGSALGCTVVREASALAGAMVNAFAYGDTALVERLVVGAEVAVPVVDTGDGPRALPVVSIEPDGGVYDYSARYTAGSTEFEVPAKLVRRAGRRVRPGRGRRPRGARAAGPVPLRPDHRRRGHRVVPRGQRRPGADRDLHGAALGARRRPGPGRRWSPIWYDSSRRAAPLTAARPDCEEPRARHHLPADHRHGQARLPGARACASR